MHRIGSAIVVSITGLAAMLIVGCPQSNAVLVPGPTGPVIAVAAASATQSDSAPFEVVFTGTDSTSSAGTIVSWTWNFGDGTTATGVSPSHTFTTPGLFSVRLTATDSAGNTGSAVVEIRIGGSTAVTAIIQATPNSGFPPLAVSFDGTASSAPDDVIRDYLWDFGDGSPTSIESTPTHIYAGQGTFTVRLTVTTAGGVSAEADPVEIVVGAPVGASLAFDGVEFATLPTDIATAVSAFTFSAWIRADQTGGTIARFGDFLITSNAVDNTISVGFNAATISAGTPVLDRVWRHIAVAYEDGVGVNIYVDGALLGGGALTGTTIPGNLIVGQGFSGNIARVAFFPELRNAGNIAADSASSAAPTGNNLVGYWPFRTGRGQQLFNTATSLFDGVRGSSTTTEAVDPDWSTDSPTF